MAEIHDFEDWEGFDWDEGNLLKNWERHRVTGSECEEVFFNRPLVSAPGEKHVESETRYYALGLTDAGRRLFVVFTIRGKSIRIISARDTSRQERKVFDEL
jgi:hypothetical protein